MEARIPVGLGREREKGDVLVLGYFATPGSPRRDKAPFVAFHRVGLELQITCMRHGDELIVRGYPYRGRRVRFISRQQMRRVVEPGLLLLDAREEHTLSEFPHVFDVQFEVRRLAAR